MSNSEQIFPANPFSAKRIRPGTVPFLFLDDSESDLPLLPREASQRHELELLTARFAAQHWWGEIVGPHGSGKSTLLAALVPALETAGRQVRLVELHDGQHCLPRDIWLDLDSSPAGMPLVVVIDGYEQLGWWTRCRMKRLCRRRVLGLLVTSHRSVGLPSLHQTSVSLALACRIVALLQTEGPRRVHPEDVPSMFSRHQGDLREILFECYDVYEGRQRKAVRQSLV